MERQRQRRRLTVLRMAIGLASVAMLHRGGVTALAQVPAQKDAPEERSPVYWQAKGYGGAMKYAYRGGAPEGPVLLLTQALATGAEAELKEDLTVMDRLVREAVQRSAAPSDGPTAMGIKLTAINRGLPLYLEGAGAVFSATVNWPLAPVGDGKEEGGGGKDKPKAPDSAWERAKRELKGGDRGEGGRDGKPDARPPFEFEQGQFDGLVAAIVKVLPEASNVRHFDADEHVFVTVSGIDEANAPARLTVKAKKSDIDAAAKGSLSAAEFRKKVGVRVTVGDAPKEMGVEYLLQRQ